MTPEQREAKKAYQRAWYAKRYAEMMADPVQREARNKQKREWKRRSKGQPSQPEAVNHDIYRTHGAFASLFALAAA